MDPAVPGCWMNRGTWSGGVLGGGPRESGIFNCTVIGLCLVEDGLWRVDKVCVLVSIMPTIGGSVGLR